MHDRAVACRRQSGSRRAGHRPRSAPGRRCRRRRRAPASRRRRSDGVRRGLPGSATIRIPLPPPPAEAFTRSGYPMPSAVVASAPLRREVTDLGARDDGNPASVMIRLVSILEPIAAIASGAGPMNVTTRPRDRPRRTRRSRRGTRSRDGWHRHRSAGRPPAGIDAQVRIGGESREPHRLVGLDTNGAVPSKSEIHRHRLDAQAGGRCATIRHAISPRLAIRILCHHILNTPKSAAPSNRRVGMHGRQRQSQHGAGVARVDDSVVEQSAARDTVPAIRPRSGPPSPGGAPRRRLRRTRGRGPPPPAGPRSTSSRPAVPGPSRPSWRSAT